MDNEQIVEKKLCSFCGAENPENARFCEQCGKRIDGEKEKKCCPVCKIEYESTVKFCNQCGTSLLNECEKYAPAQEFSNTQIKKEKPKKKKMPRERKYKLIKSSVILFVSVLLLAFSFLPIVTYEISELNGSRVSPSAELDLTAIDHIIFLFDSMEELTEEELATDEMMNEAQSLYTSLYFSTFGSFTGIDDDEQELIGEIYKLSIRIGLRSEEQSVTVTTLYMAILCLIYMVFTVALFGFALYQFIRVLFGKEVSFKLTSTLLCLAPFIILAVIITSVGGIAYISTNMSFSLPALIVSALAALGLVIDSYAFGNRRIETGKLVRGTLSIALAVVCMCLTLSSAFSVELMGKFKGSEEEEEAETTFIADNYQAFEMNENALSKYEETEDRDIKRSIRMIINKYTEDEIEDGDADFEIQELALLIAYRSAGSDVLSFSAAYYLGVVVMLLCGIMGWQLLCTLCDGEERKSFKISLYVAALCTAFAYLLLNISFVSSCNSMIAKVELTQMAEFSVSLVPFVVLALLALTVISVIDIKKSKKPSPVLFTQIAEEEANEITEEPIEQTEEVNEQTEEQIEAVEEITENSEENE